MKQEVARGADKAEENTFCVATSQCSKLHSHFLEERRLPRVRMWPRKTLYGRQPRNEAELHSHFLEGRRLPKVRTWPRKTLFGWQPRNEAQGFIRIFFDKRRLPGVQMWPRKTFYVWQPRNAASCIRIFGVSAGCPGDGYGRGKYFLRGNLAMKRSFIRIFGISEGCPGCGRGRDRKSVV